MKLMPKALSAWYINIVCSECRFKKKNPHHTKRLGRCVIFKLRIFISNTLTTHRNGGLLDETTVCVRSAGVPTEALPLGTAQGHGKSTTTAIEVSAAPGVVDRSAIWATTARIWTQSMRQCYQECFTESMIDV